MDTDDLNTLAALLERQGLTVARCDPEQRIHVTNPISSRLAEEITLQAGGYCTGFGYEIGTRGQEAAAADRIAYLLGAAPPRKGAAS